VRRRGTFGEPNPRGEGCRNARGFPRAVPSGERKWAPPGAAQWKLITPLQSTPHGGFAPTPLVIMADHVVGVCFEGYFTHTHTATPEGLWPPSRGDRLPLAATMSGGCETSV